MDALILIIGAYLAMQFAYNVESEAGLYEAIIAVISFIIALVLFFLAVIPVAGRIIWPTPF